MHYDSFKEALLALVRERLGPGYQVRLQETVKTNNVLMTGICVTEKEGTLSPTVYLEPFYERYQKGDSLDYLASLLLAFLGEHQVKIPFDLEALARFPEMREKLRFRLVNREWNRPLLDEVPHRDFLDLSILYSLLIEDPALGTGSILVRNEHMKHWDKTEDDLFSVTSEIAPANDPWTCTDIYSLLKKSGFEMPEIPSPLHILTTKNRSYGAAGILYPDALESLSEIFQDDFYLLPGSVHEFLILPARELPFPPEALNRTIVEVNTYDLNPTERLSDHYYYYSRESGKITF
ncbi:MAG: hypothetical protein IJ773_09960 [Lachnospiraceae bacterium]|nr:hypothetical protein [Lachnospiraceae bacterium]